MRQDSRTHRVDLDWLFDQIGLNPGIQIKNVNTSNKPRTFCPKDHLLVKGGPS